MKWNPKRPNGTSNKTNPRLSPQGACVPTCAPAPMCYCMSWVLCKAALPWRRAYTLRMHTKHIQLYFACLLAYWLTSQLTCLLIHLLACLTRLRVTLLRLLDFILLYLTWIQFTLLTCLDHTASTRQAHEGTDTEERANQWMTHM